MPYSARSNRAESTHVPHCQEAGALSEQSERVAFIKIQLITNEVSRRQAVRAGDRAEHNRLANLNREIIGGISTPDLRSIVTGWMLELGKDADEKEIADSA